MHDSVLLFRKCHEVSHQALRAPVSLNTKLSLKEDLHLPKKEQKTVKILNLTLSLIWIADDL